MSDGISEGYRAAKAHDEFEKKWQSVQADNILLDTKADLKKINSSKLLKRLLMLCSRIEISHETGWLVKYKWGESFQTSIASKDADFFPKKKRYKISAYGCPVSKEFYGYNLDDLMRDVVLYLEWLDTEHGKTVAEYYNRY